MAQVRTRKRGKTFSYIFEAGKKADGRRNVVEKGGFATKDAAYKAGVTSNVKLTMLQNYQSYLKVNILSHLGNVTVQDLTPATLDAWTRKLVELGFSYSSMRVA